MASKVHSKFLLPNISTSRKLQIFDSTNFAEMATEIFTADSPGLTTLRVENFDHPRADGPRWPLDPNTTWTPQA